MCHKLPEARVYLRYTGRISLSHSYCCRLCCCTYPATNRLACFLAGWGLGSGGCAQLGREGEESSARTPKYNLVRREPRFCFEMRLRRRSNGGIHWDEGVFRKFAEINGTEQRF